MIWSGFSLRCNCFNWFSAFVWTADTEIKVPSVEAPELTCYPLKPGVGQNVATHASPTARNFIFTSPDLDLPDHFTIIFFKSSPYFSTVILANVVFSVRVHSLCGVCVCLWGVCVCVYVCVGGVHACVCVCDPPCHSRMKKILCITLIY